MYNPTEIELINVMSYTNETIYPELHTSIIYGENQYDKGQKNNGAGKSGIIEGFAIGLTGSPLRKGIVISDLIKDGTDSMTIYIKLENSLFNSVIEITRVFYRKTNKSQEIIIKENGVEQEITNPNHANSIILEYLGIQREDLLNYYLISKDRYKSFFGFSDTDKKEIISRFSNIELVDPGITSVDTTINSLLSTRNTSTNNKLTAEGKLEAFEEQLEKEEKRNLDQETKDTIQGYINNINQAQANINQSTTRKNTIIATIKDINTKIKGFEEDGERLDIDIVELDNKINTITTSFSSLYKDKSVIESKSIEADALLNNKATCPQCNFEFSTYNSEKDLKAVHQAIPMLNKLKLEITEKIQKAELDSSKLSLAKDEVSRLKSGLNNTIRQLKNDLPTHQASLNSIDNNINKFNSYIDSQNALIEQLKNNGLSSNVSSLKSSINNQKTIISNLEVEIDNINSQIDYKESLKSQFIKFKTSLVNKTVKVIEFHCNRILSKMKSSLSINIQGYKLKRDGKSLVEKITTTVHREGFPIGNFWRFSTGERARIEIANILALQSLINSSSSSGGLNLLFLDEIISSIDSEGITAILNELNDSFKKPIYIVTHATYNGSFNNKLKVVKDHSGNSHIEILSGE